MPKVDIQNVAVKEGSSYPSPYDEPCQKRRVQRLGDSIGLARLGVNLVTLMPGAWASQRHWHAEEDEFAYVIEGEIVLVEDEGETILHASECAGWPAGVKNGHHLINRSDAIARFLIIGNRNDNDCGEYSDIDMAFARGRYSSGKKDIFRHKDGSPFDE
jgi:uncharacterized cupin superfamily protein